MYIITFLKTAEMAVGWGAGGIILNGLNVIIENNVFADSKGAGISMQSYNGAWGTEVEAAINKNIFYNIDTWAKTGSGWVWDIK